MLHFSGNISSNNGVSRDILRRNYSEENFEFQVELDQHLEISNCTLKVGYCIGKEFSALVEKAESKL